MGPGRSGFKLNTAELEPLLLAPSVYFSILNVVHDNDELLSVDVMMQHHAVYETKDYNKSFQFHHAVTGEYRAFHSIFP